MDKQIILDSNSLSMDKIASMKEKAKTDPEAAAELAAQKERQREYCRNYYREHLIGDAEQAPITATA